MKDIKDFQKPLLKTYDGRSAIAWVIIIATIAIKSILQAGFILEQIKYVFFAILILAFFVEFRIINEKSTDDTTTNMWGFTNINGFGLFLLYMEFFK